MILVTGATGNAGGEVARTLADAGQRMRAPAGVSGPAALPPGVKAVAVARRGGHASGDGSPRCRGESPQRGCG